MIDNNQMMMMSISNGLNQGGPSSQPFSTRFSFHSNQSKKKQSPVAQQKAKPSL